MPNPNQAKVIRGGLEVLPLIREQLHIKPVVSTNEESTMETKGPEHTTTASNDTAAAPVVKDLRTIEAESRMAKDDSIRRSADATRYAAYAFVGAVVVGTGVVIAGVVKDYRAEKAGMAS